MMNVGRETKEEVDNDDKRKLSRYSKKEAVDSASGQTDSFTDYPALFLSDTVVV